MNAAVSLHVETDGIAILNWDDRNAKVNVFDPASIDGFLSCVRTIASDESIRGVMITSGKKTFHAGADLKMVSGFFDMSAEGLWNIMSEIMHGFYTLETCGKPVAAVINGHCLGGGFELALAAHARFVADDPDIRIGLPESKLGLMPGFGGTQRFTRLAPWEKAVPLVVEGATFDPETALSLGFANAVAPQEKLEQEARDWLCNNSDAKQPWHVKEYTAPGTTREFEYYFHKVSAELAGGGSAQYPWKPLIAEAIYHGLQIPIEPALRLEIRRFIEMIRSPASMNTFHANVLQKTK
ncbi:enoyl-CoA hydratase/isomerase family protein [Roseovarius sp.]|uniref:enoyl-CoA hydratase/isomerase family protein n=1 Tax=Roseovarius sp. TaxID=1486281 RepID=UPI003A976A4A